MDGRGFKLETNPVYPMPNDSDEITRLNNIQYLICYALQGHFKAPVEEHLKRGIRVLDVGCGAGAWCTLNSFPFATSPLQQKLARLYPSSTFVGTDLVNIFNDSFNSSSPPPNVSFQIVDTTKARSPPP
ncbi:hypothetical protein BC938DRAFT_478688 [Jimgerdemannia flammicorona]|uniref:Methyltransferase domain-containing protein n=1 Tax=Jimgerdemannia flammicorona TaxID=994334 RepID=A0A433QY68_9FUNG|nr:hypothetical protein BC938DRAFT_478688 [Jimgerdemannia flammicorona]